MKSLKERLLKPSAAGSCTASSLILLPSYFLTALEMLFTMPKVA